MVPGRTAVSLLLAQPAWPHVPQTSLERRRSVAMQVCMPSPGRNASSLSAVGSAVLTVWWMVLCESRSMPSSSHMHDSTESSIADYCSITVMVCAAADGVSKTRHQQDLSITMTCVVLNAACLLHGDTADPACMAARGCCFLGVRVQQVVCGTPLSLAAALVSCQGAFGYVGT
jgi:hypothetical protein